MAPFNKKNYNILSSVVKHHSLFGISGRDKSSDVQIYKAFKLHESNTKEDIIRIAGMAYSWMPTMLDLYFDGNYNWDRLISSIQKLKRGDESVRVELTLELSEMINHSVVGASKVMHIISPRFAPIIDSRVARGWNEFFCEDIRNGSIQALPSSWSFNVNNPKTLLKKVDAYIYYWNCLLEWRVRIKNLAAIRELELSFYILGEK